MDHRSASLEPHAPAAPPVVTSEGPGSPLGLPAAPGFRPHERLELAKWPPDDDDGGFQGLGPGGFQSPPGGGVPGGGAPGGGDYGDGNFKKGAIKPVAIAVGTLIALGGAAALYFGFQAEADKMGKDEIAKERRSVAVLPKAQAIPKWREWAAKGDVPTLQQEAFAQLAWARDMGSVPLLIQGLKSVDHRVRGVAAMALVELGPQVADQAKGPLLAALKEADSTDKPQVAWALAVFKEPQAFDEVLNEYRAGHLSRIQRLDESPTFDPEVVASMVPIDKLASLAGDESEAVRQLVATSLSRTGDPRWTSTLTKLVGDKSIEVAREAAVGLGRIADEQAMGPLLNALSKADKDSRQRFLEALRDGVGAKGLLLALRIVPKDGSDKEKFQTKQIFDMLKDLQDPRGGDALAEYLALNPKPHWRTEAAMRLAEIGDTRAVPHLAWRLTQDPLKLYTQEHDPELRRDDNERVVSARYLADLVILHPDKQTDIRMQAEGAVMGWATAMPQPHANALRFLAAANSQAALPKMRAWANPREPFPKAGSQDMPMSWATAQSALRYLGWMKDSQSWGLLQTQLFRRPPEIDATMESLMQGGLGVLGMTLRALGFGAADGFAQWGDARAFPLLVKYIDEPKENEQSRLEACFALAWVATDAQMKEVVQKVKAADKPDPKTAVVRKCYLETLVRKPVPDANAGLVDLLKPEADLDVRHQAARAIGMGGVSKELATQLQAKLGDSGTRGDAALALLLGGDADMVSMALASYEDVPPEDLETLKDIYNKSFSYWSDRNYENGDVARWVANAESARYVRIRGVLQDWPRLELARSLQGIEYDNGPHSITRVQLRKRLYDDARSSDATKRDNAIAILKFMRERGVLMALRQEAPPLGDMARRAFFEVMNPKAVTDRIPDAVSKGSGAP